MTDEAFDVRDQAIRLAAFSFLDAQRAVHGDVLSWALLQRGFDFDGHRVALLSMQGIFKPALLRDIPLSIRTTPVEEGKPRPYEDAIGADGLLRYRFRGTDPQHPHNVGLRVAMMRQVPLVYLYGVAEGQYLPAYPVYIVGEDTADLAFRVAVDDRRPRTLWHSGGHRRFGRWRRELDAGTADGNVGHLTAPVVALTLQSFVPAPPAPQLLPTGEVYALTVSANAVTNGGLGAAIGCTSSRSITTSHGST